MDKKTGLVIAGLTLVYGLTTSLVTIHRTRRDTARVVRYVKWLNRRLEELEQPLVDEIFNDIVEHYND